jgi:hypothetical protein
MGEGSAPESGQQVRQHALRIFEYFRIPISNNSKSGLPQASISWPIALFGNVLPTIHFDHQPPFKTNKVKNVRSERHLPAKLDTVEAAVT